MAITINGRVATKVLLDIYHAYARREKLFRFVRAETDAVQYVNVPPGYERGSPSHIIWLFFATLTDRRQVSENVYPAHIDLLREYPGLYGPEATQMNPEDLANILIKYKVGIPRQSAGFWIRCADTLWNMWGGNPVRLYEGGSIAAALEWKKKQEEDPLPGFGPKIMSLFGLYLAELGLVSLLDAFPVDVHVQRVFLNTGCIIGASERVFNEEMEAVLRPFLTDFCAEQGISWIDLSHALWFLGNRVCNGCHRDNTAPILCPVYADCQGGVSSRTYFSSGFWNLTGPRHLKGGSYVFCLEPGPLFGGELVSVQ